MQNRQHFFHNLVILGPPRLGIPTAALRRVVLRDGLGTAYIARQLRMLFLSFSMLPAATVPGFFFEISVFRYSGGAPAAKRREPGKGNRVGLRAQGGVFCPLEMMVDSNGI